MGGIESRASFFKVKNGERERAGISKSPRGKKGNFNSPLQNMTVTPIAVAPMLLAVVPLSRKPLHTKQGEAPGGTTS
jgi:hypothetical protein